MGVCSGWNCFLLRYGGEVFLEKEVSPVRSITVCCGRGGIQSELACNYTCLCCVIDIIFKINKIGVGRVA